jgi:hypothetical protein
MHEPIMPMRRHQATWRIQSGNKLSLLGVGYKPVIAYLGQVKKAQKSA